MSPAAVELALRKQRLLWQSASQRDALAAAAAGLAPAFAVADAVRDGARWLRRHPEWVAGTAVALLVARPRFIWRWLRRGFLGWQLWRKVGEWRPAAGKAAGFSRKT